MFTTLGLLCNNIVAYITCLSTKIKRKIKRRFCVHCLRKKIFAGRRKKGYKNSIQGPGRVKCGSVPVHFISSFAMCSSQCVLRIFLRHVPSNPLSAFGSAVGSLTKDR